MLKRAQSDIATEDNTSLLVKLNKTLEEEKEIACKELEEAHHLLMEDDYLVKDDMSTEMEIDKFIEAQTRNGMDMTNPDYLVLLRWLESFKPVQTDQKLKTTDSKVKAA